MSPRKVLFISAGALILSFVIPALVALALMELLPLVLGDSGWRSITYLVVALIAGHWTQGMLWGVALLTPLSALVERLAPKRVDGRWILACLLVVWAVPAQPLSRRAAPALARFRLTRPTPSECITGVTLNNFEVMRPDGTTAIFGVLSNMGTLHLTSVEAEFAVRPASSAAADPARVDTILCEAVQRESWDRPGAKPVTFPRTLSRFRCDVPSAGTDADLPTAEFVRFRSWSCDELGDQRYN